MQVFNKNDVLCSIYLKERLRPQGTTCCAQRIYLTRALHAADVVKMTYKEVLAEVCKVANWLKSKGVSRGDTVALYLPMVLELPIAMLACARLGAVHSVVFGGFSADALADRIVNSEANVLITANGVMRGAKVVELKKVADQACAKSLQEGIQVSADTAL